MILLVTRLGRKVLMNGDRVSTAFTLLLCVIWFSASLAGAYLCCSMSPLPSSLAVALPSVLAVVSMGVVYRNVVQLPGQQSIAATAGVTVMIVAGTLSALYLHHAL